MAVTISGASQTGKNFTATSTSQQLLLNPDFELGSNGQWAENVVSGTAHNIIVTKTAWTAPWIPPHGGIYQAQLCGANGTFYNSQTDALKQTVAIPSTAASATLTFWVAIATKETTGIATNDTLKVQVLNSGGTVLTTLMTLSNLNGGATASWAQKSADVSAYKGQTIQIKFLGTTNGTLGTVFLIDDTALNVTSGAFSAMEMDGDTPETLTARGSSVADVHSAVAEHWTPARAAGRSGGPNARMEETEVYSAEGGNAAMGTGASARSETLGALTVRFYVWDHLGTTRIVLNSSGAIESRHDYEPYGVEIRPVYDSPNTHRYTGHERDSGTGLDYMHYRFYGSNTGRFMKPDNIGGNMANPQSWNLYAYVHGNPVNFNDPTGHYAGGAGDSNIFSAANSTGAHWDGGDPTLAFGGLLENAGTINYLFDENGNLWGWGNTPPPAPPGTIVVTSGQSQGGEQKANQPTQASPSGPPDPSNPSKPLYRNKAVQKQSDRAFMRTGDGTERGGLAEAGFAIYFRGGKVVCGPIIDNVHDDGKPNELSIHTDWDAIAILHTHGNRADPKPGPGDYNSPVPNFVRSASALYVTVPGTHEYIQLQP